MERRIRLATYNAHACVGTDGMTSIERIAEVIGSLSADVIAVQELVITGEPGGPGDQPAALSATLRMHCTFSATVVARGRRYGHALFSRWPVTAVRDSPLPTVSGSLLERRSALRASLAVGGRELAIVSTHLGLDRRERLLQARALRGAWGRNAGRRPFVLCGDLNCLPGSRAYRTLATGLRDVQRIDDRRALPTFPSVFPLLRIDHVLISEGVACSSVFVARARWIRRASDHLPVVATLDLPETE